MIQGLKNALEKNRKQRDERRKAKNKQRNIERQKKQGREQAQKQRQVLLKKIDEERAQNEPDKAKIAKWKVDVGEYHHLAQKRDRQHDHAKNRGGELRSKIAWNTKRITVLKRKLKKAKDEAAQGATPAPQSWHGNGHEWHNLTWNAKQLLAIAVVNYGCYCTSITRSWGTGSHHESVPTRGFDCGGSRMTTFQSDLRYGKIEGYPLGELLELYGPINAACADNGVGVVMAEGSGNESLHDNHVHAFVYG
jgi:hypothetical protein